MPVPTGLIIAGTPVKRDGGVIATPGGSFGTTRFDEVTEIFGVGVGVSTLPKSGLATIDQINASATEYCQPGDVIAKVTTSIAGVSNTTMQKMDKGQTLQEFKRDSLSGVAVATAIRNNQWSDVSGVFTTAPATFSSAWGTDFSSVPTGGISPTNGNKFRFLTGGKNPSGVTYKGPTCW